MIRLLYDLFCDVVDFFFPNLCAACDHHLVKGEECICVSCLLRLPLTRFESANDNPLFRQFAGRARLESALAYCHFTKGGRIQRLMHRLKYANRPDIGLKLGQLFGHSLLNARLLADADVILPIPLHKHKLKSRGYNQAQCIAEGMAQVMSIVVQPDAIRRVKNTSTQTRKSRYDRAGNVDQAFSVQNPDRFSGLHLVLVDDVVTTGATLVAAAAELQKQIPGVRVSIAALAFARA